MPLLIFFRILQGAGGGGMGPSEQAILADTFPPEKRGLAFSVYGMAVVVAPAIGPTLGGWITDNYDWRWIFFINVPVGLLSLFLTSTVVEDPPWLKKLQGRRHQDRLHRPVADRPGHRLPAGDPRQGPAGRLVRLELHHHLRRHRRRRAGVRW